MGTSLGLPARWILSVAAMLLCVCALEAPSSAQEKPKHPRHKPAAAKANAKAKSDAAPAPKPSAPAAPPPQAPKITASPRRPTTPVPTPSSTAALWKRVVEQLEGEYVARHPEQGFAMALKKPEELTLGTYGASATVRWREALVDALGGLGRIESEHHAAANDAELNRLSDWIELELLLLDGVAPSIQSPSSYVRRASDTLRAASEALWIAPEDRQRELGALLSEFPVYFRDARVSLVSPVPDEIELTLHELDDLRERVNTLLATLPEAPAPKPLGKPKAPVAAARPADARAALDTFRTWLLGERESAGGRMPRLDADEWTQLLRLATGKDWQASELKASALRELARLDLAPGSEHRERSHVADPEGLPLRLGSAALQAVKISCSAHCLRDTLDPKGLEFAVETSPRAGLASVWLRPGSADVSRAYIQLPHSSWSPGRITTRCEGLRKEQAAALGVRYGLAGEGLFATLVRGAPQAPAMLRDNRMVREGLGLYALDWMSRVDWVENSFRGNADVEREFERQRGYEAARLIAAMELHAEGLSLRETALAFQRRTGVDEDTATAEAFAAERDPLRGIGYLGLHELLALEQRIAEKIEPRKALRVTLQLVARHPELRPRDLAWEREIAAPTVASGEEKPGPALEKPGPPQQEHPRSR